MVYLCHNLYRYAVSVRSVELPSVASFEDARMLITTLVLRMLVRYERPCNVFSGVHEPLKAGRSV